MNDQNCQKLGFIAENKGYKIGSYKKMSFGFLNLISLNEKNQRNSDGL